MKKNSIKKLLAIVLISMIILGSFPIGVSAAWKQNNSEWWYSEGNSYATGWRNIDGNWYYFYPENGYMAVQAMINGYYVNEKGAWVDDSIYNIKAAKAQELVKKYLLNNGKYVPSFVLCSAEEDNSWVIHCYDVISYPGEGSHTATSGWYYVDKDTGSISSMF